jgi:FkbM family methyltransferase
LAWLKLKWRTPKPTALDLGRYLSRHGIEPRGVLHVGAHEAQELESYERLGFRAIVFVEANRALFERLRDRLHGRPGVTVIHAAATDHDGEVELNVTTNDQSSSILALGVHAKVYPWIKVARRERVPARRLDTLLAEHGLEAADFNVLHLDIQGAELLALRGGEQTLRSIDLVESEVNIAEMYRGCALLPELERYLGDHGLHRAALMAFHPGWGDAIFVRGPAVSMRALGEKGELANQMFQYFALTRHAARWGAVVQTPPWAGQALFGLDDPAPVLEFPEHRDEDPESAGSLLDAVAPPQEIELRGVYQPHSRELVPDRDAFRRVFTPVPAIQAAVQPFIDHLRTRGRTLVAMHLHRAPAGWYLAWLEEIWPRLDAPVLHVASDDLEPCLRAFRRYRPTSRKDAPRRAKAIGSYLDIHVMAQADALAISSSSASFVASLLNQRATRFVRPVLATQRLEPVDPWDSPRG